MHDHDLDLIASLADGSLDDQAEARARVESCQECRLEYEAQILVLAALAGTESATLTEFEKAALHRDLWTELRKEPGKNATTTPWWYRLSYAAAGLFVVVGLVAVANQLGGGDDAGQAEAFSEVSSGLDEASGQDAAAPTSPTGGETESATQSTVAAAGDGAPTTVGSTSEETATFAALAAETRMQQLPPTVRTAPTADQAACLTEAGLEDHEVVGTVDKDRTYLIAVPAGVDLDTETPVTFVDAETCQVVHVED
ncbi:MAG TPA: hypothetical protein VIH32_03450 [Acidimicrobiia bacterium]